MNLNKVFIIGRITADPQLRTTPGGQSVTSFSIATNRTWTGKTGNREEEVEFHNVVAWGKQAEIASQFLTKGSLIFVEGRLQTRSWQDKQGQSRKTTEIICERLQLGPKPAHSTSSGRSDRFGSEPQRETSDESSDSKRPSAGGGFSPRPPQAGSISSQPSSSSAPAADMPPLEEIPIINLEDEMKAEDLPF